MKNGKLYLIPCEISENSHFNFPYLEILNDLDGFICENLRTGRRYLRKIGFKSDFNQLIMLELTGRSTTKETIEILGQTMGKTIGLLSEAGCPGIADPGAPLIKLGHENNIQVIPLIGPSSIFLALMASGLNGQQFTFHGYLPIKEPDKTKKIKWLESQASSSGYSQIFMETPYRNNQLLTQLTKTLKSETLLCIACEITSQREFIKTQSVQKWKSTRVDLHKKPCIFIVGVV